MTEGVGLDTNVAQLYETLAQLYEPGDRVFLFGFSRGAFTVRALAGLTWRYGLPASQITADAKTRFAEAWPLFKDEFPDEDGAKARRALQFRVGYGQPACPIHFLGLWDTVKSYGGLKPVMLPHLRHNPSVATVRQHWPSTSAEDGSSSRHGDGSTRTDTGTRLRRDQTQLTLN
jgi:uncharacterized protein (DUF2235 family)